MSKPSKTLIIATLIIIVACGNLVPYAVSEDYWSHVTGCITVNGEPRGGVDVNGFGLSAKTDSSGYYRLNPMPATNGCIIASFHGYSSQSKQMTTPGTPPYPEVNLDISMPKPTATPTLVPTPNATSTPTATPGATQKPSVTPTPTVRPTLAPTQVNIPTPPPIPSIAPESQPTATPTVTPSATLAITPTLPAVPNGTATPTQVPSLTPTASPTNTVETRSGYSFPAGTVSYPQWDHVLSATPLIAANSSENNTTIQKNTTPSNVTDAAQLDSKPSSGTRVEAPAWNPNVNSKRAASTSPGLPREIVIIGMLLACAAYIGFVAYSVIRK